MSECVVRMEMPAEHCMDCRYMVSRDNDDCILQSDEANERAESWEDLKAGCPFICTLPEGHGRLVREKDVRWAIDDIVIEIAERIGHVPMTKNETMEYVNHLPTIVPAAAERSET